MMKTFKNATDATTVPVREAERILRGVINREYIGQRIESGDFRGERRGGEWQIDSSDLEALRRMIVEKDYSSVRRLSVDAGYIDFDSITISGRILDMGGGGEAIASRAFFGRTVSLDKSVRELNESGIFSDKVCGDCQRMPFADSVFDGAAAFFTFMYMPLKMRSNSFFEAKRVLRRGGTLIVCEARVASSFFAPMTLLEVRAKIKAGGETFNASYGAVLAREGQSMKAFRNLASECGFREKSAFSMKNSFIIAFTKR